MDRKHGLIEGLHMNITNTFATANSGIFERILFSRIALKDIFAALKIHDWCIIYSKEQSDFGNLQGFFFFKSTAFQY